MRTIKIFSISLFVLFSFNLTAQLKVNASGQVDIDGQGGAFSTQAPRITINSNGTAINSDNTGLTLYNSNNTLNNWTRLHFATKESDNNIEDFASFAVQYKDRSTSNKRADFHIATSRNGYNASRFSIYSDRHSDGGPWSNDVAFFFNTGWADLGKGVWLDDTASGEPTFRPNGGWYGYLGTSQDNWYKLYVGYAYYNHHANITSDRRNKKDIEELDDGTLNKLNKVRGVKYKVKNDLKTLTTIDTNDIYLGDERPSFSPELLEQAKNRKEKEMKNAGEKEHFGFIAQELMEVFPEVVNYDSINDSYSIQYTALIPIMVEGMKEQQVIIDAQSLKLKELEQIINGGKEKSSNLKGTSVSTELDVTDITTNAFLYQNTPNPFSYDTEIRFFIPKEARKANLYVFNLQGGLLMNKPINAKGDGSLTINGTELKPGMYIYSLHIDGQEVDSKRMVLTE